MTEGTAPAGGALARPRPMADDARAVLPVIRPDSSAEASMGLPAGLVDRWFRMGIVSTDSKTPEGFMWRGRASASA